MTPADKLRRKEWEARLTPEEFEAIVQALATRLQNFLFVDAERCIRQALEQMRLWPGATLDRHRPEDKVTVSCPIDFVMNDLAEVVGGVRRSQKGARR